MPDSKGRIVVCCGNGEMAILAAATLRELGFVNVAALQGGLKSWQEKGFSLSRS
jgi:rhodanese-related sulfurtransferase